MQPVLEFKHSHCGGGCDCGDRGEEKGSGGEHSLEIGGGFGVVGNGINGVGGGDLVEVRGWIIALHITLHLARHLFAGLCFFVLGKP